MNKLDQCEKTRALGGWMNGWVGGWMEARAGLRIAYSDQKLGQRLEIIAPT